MSRFAQALALQFYKWNIIDNEEDINPLRFGIELIITQFITYLTMFILSILFHKVYETIIYAIVFTLFRKYIQGYHADTFMMCYFLTTLNYLFVIFALELSLPYYILNIFIILFVYNYMFYFSSNLYNQYGNNNIYNCTYHEMEEEVL